MNRFRISDTPLTHGYHMIREGPPVCNSCQVRLLVFLVLLIVCHLSIFPLIDVRVSTLSLLLLAVQLFFAFLRGGPMAGLLFRSDKVPRVLPVTRYSPIH